MPSAHLSTVWGGDEGNPILWGPRWTNLNMSCMGGICTMRFKLNKFNHVWGQGLWPRTDGRRWGQAPCKQNDKHDITFPQLRWFAVIIEDWNVLSGFWLSILHSHPTTVCTILPLRTKSVMAILHNCCLDCFHPSIFSLLVNLNVRAIEVSFGLLNCQRHSKMSPHKSVVCTFLRYRLLLAFIWFPEGIYHSEKETNSKVILQLQGWTQNIFKSF